MIRTHIFKETKKIMENIQKMIEVDKSLIDDLASKKRRHTDASGTLIAFMTHDDATYISFLAKKVAIENRLKMPHKHTLIIGYFYDLDFNKEWEYSYNSQVTEDTL
jgi:hypothetical protein